LIARGADLAAYDTAENAADSPICGESIAALAKGDGRAIAASRLAYVTPPGYVAYGLTYGIVCSEWVPTATRGAVLAEGRKAFSNYPTVVLADTSCLPSVKPPVFTPN
jgi:hypothetical protein